MLQRARDRLTICNERRRTSPPPPFGEDGRRSRSRSCAGADGERQRCGDQRAVELQPTEIICGPQSTAQTN
eukprot:690452-Pyramimonas_sp.AAC.1